MFHFDPLDHLLAARGYQMVRYADDFVILCQTASEAASALSVVVQWVTENELGKQKGVRTLCLEG